MANGSKARVNLDAESRGIIFEGASVNQLADLFEMKNYDVARRLGDLKPIGFGRQNNPLYSVKDAAPKLIKIEITPEMIDQYMQRVNHVHLPPMLSKFYWEGKRTRELYLERANELWFTEDVIRVAAEAFQSLRMSLMLLPDNMREEAGLTESQFKKIQHIVDDALEGTRVRLVADLRKPDQVGPGPEEEDGAL